MTDNLPKHSKLGASSASRWMACPGSIALIAKLPPQETSEYAAEGTAAHELAEACLLGGTYTKYFLGNMFNGFEVTMAMAEAVQVYIDVIRSDMKELEDAEMKVETKFHLKDLHVDLFGTNDCSLAEPFGKLIVYDYKHGAGVPVEVENNEQLMYYALGAMQGEEFDEIEIVIVQPRCFEVPDVQRQTFTPEQMEAWSNELVEAAKATENPNAELHAGDHCKFCPAAATCPALHNRCMELAKLDFADVDNVSLTPAEELSETDMIAVLDHAKMIDGWIKQVQKHAEALALNGKDIPGYKLVQKKTNRKWTDEDMVAGALARKYGKAEVHHPAKLLSIAQIEKKYGKTNSELQRIYKKYITKPEGGLVLVSNSDKRQAITQTPGELDFKDTETLEEDDFDTDLFG